MGSIPDVQKCTEAEEYKIMSIVNYAGIGLVQLRTKYDKGLVISLFSLSTYLYLSLFVYIPSSLLPKTVFASEMRTYEIFTE